MEIKLSDNFPNWPLERQTPSSSGAWEGNRFHRNRRVEACDAWVVSEGLLEEETVLCPPENTVFCAMEPESVRSYHPDFLNQFAVIVTCQSSIRHRNARLYQQAQPWNIGTIRHSDGSVGADLDFDQMRDFRPTKTKVLSVSSTRKTLTAGHTLRIRFIEELKDALGDTLDVHWLGPETTTDKRHSILPYQYHIVLENSRYSHYWTEKLADCYLGGAFPLYYGCPNLADYFPLQAFASVDIHNARSSAEVIKRVVAEGWTPDRQQAVDQARARVLYRYNFYPMLVELLKDRPVVTAARVTLRPESHFAPLWSRAKNALNWVRGAVGMRK